MLNLQFDWKWVGQGGMGNASLTIMFSRECLASQQLRNTGMKRFLKEGKITCQGDKKFQWAGHNTPSHTSAQPMTGTLSKGAGRRQTQPRYSQWSWRERRWSSPGWRGHATLAPKRCPRNQKNMCAREWVSEWVCARCCERHCARSQETLLSCRPSGNHQQSLLSRTEGENQSCCDEDRSL